MMQNNILIITSWSLQDGIFQSAVLPYLEIIHSLNKEGKIYVYTEEKSIAACGNPKAILKPDNVIWVPNQYYRFGIKKIASSTMNLLRLVRLIKREKIKYIHAFCTPAGAMGYILSKITGAKLVIDSFEPHAESMVENGTWSKGSLSYKLLWNLERRQAAHASHCIGIASGMDQYAGEKWGVTLKNYLVRPMCVDLEAFKPNEEMRNRLRKKLGWENKIVGVYAGKFGGIYFDKEVFDFFKVAQDFWADKLAILIVTGENKDSVMSLVSNSLLPTTHIHITSADYKDMPDWLSVADFALTPVKPVPTKRFCSPIKDGEYWAMNLPIIIPDNISDDSAIVREEGIGYVLKHQSYIEYKNAITFINDYLINKIDNETAPIRKIASQYRNIESAITVYKSIYD